MTSLVISNIELFGFALKALIGRGTLSAVVQKGVAKLALGVFEGIVLTFTLQTGVLSLADGTVRVEVDAGSTLSLFDVLRCVHAGQTVVPFVAGFALCVEDTARRTLSVLQKDLLSLTVRAGVAIIAGVAAVNGVLTELTLSVLLEILYLTIDAGIGIALEASFEKASAIGAFAVAVNVKAFGTHVASIGVALGTRIEAGRAF